MSGPRPVTSRVSRGLLAAASFAAAMHAPMTAAQTAPPPAQAGDAPGALGKSIRFEEAAGVDEALRAVEARDFVRAAALLQPIANAGDGEAQFLLGLLNESDALVGASQAAAAAWYAKAAASGHAKAQNNLGAMYYDGRGVAKDLGQARTWYGRAAELGNPQAQLNYALMLGQGLGSGAANPEQARDPAAMLRWLLLAAAQDYPRAQVQLGKIYLSGRDFPPDVAEGAYWFRLAAEQNSTEAQYLLAELLQKGEGVPRDLVAAIAWFERAAAGEPSTAKAAACYELGVIYELGLGTLADANKSAAYFRQAADAGNAKAIEKLGRRR